MSSGCIGNVCLPPSPYKMTHQAEITQTHLPIPDSSITVLPNNTNSSSIRTTFSAIDMVAHLTQNRLSSLKRAQSTDQLSFLDNHDHDDDQRGAFEDIWSSIQKNSESKPLDLPPPYVHPLVKRSASLLSQKSLEVCTESLGSETGSEPGLLSDSDKESHDVHEPININNSNNNAVVDHDHDHDQHQHQEAVIKCSVFTNIRKSSLIPAAVVPKAPVRSLSFPPPLPSLARRREGDSNLHMRSHRHDGRLILEAVPVPSVHRLCAHRHGGRLRLTMSDDIQNLDDDQDESDKEEDQDQEEIVESEEKEKDLQFNTKARSSSKSSSLIVNKLIELTASKNRSPSAWPRRFNASVAKAMNDKQSSLPPRPMRLPVNSASTAMNAYEYYWRRNAGGLLLAHKRKSPTAAGGRGGDREAAVETADLKAEEEFLIPFLRGCKEPTQRRSAAASLLFWDSEPYCIATS